MFVLLEPEISKRKKNEEKTYSTVYCYRTGLPLDFGLNVNIAIEILWSRWWIRITPGTWRASHKFRPFFSFDTNLKAYLLSSNWFRIEFGPVEINLNRPFFKIVA